MGVTITAVTIPPFAPSPTVSVPKLKASCPNTDCKAFNSQACYPFMNSCTVSQISCFEFPHCATSTDFYRVAADSHVVMHVVRKETKLLNGWNCWRNAGPNFGVVASSVQQLAYVGSRSIHRVFLCLQQINECFQIFPTRCGDPRWRCHMCGLKG